MRVASFPSADTPPLEAELAFAALREADYILLGPGSPTYTVRTLAPTPVPHILSACVRRGGCLTAASAAALTVGRFTLPVYEIYKVGEPPRWVEGLDLLADAGLNLAVVPHWNNAEGGTHDTRCCFMGLERFRRLERQLPEDTGVLGLDEHTALVVDLARREAVVHGLGGVTLRRCGRETVFPRSARLTLADLQPGAPAAPPDRPTASPSSGTPDSDPAPGDDFWNRVHALERRFQEHLDGDDPRSAAGALLDLDALVWQAHRDLEDAERIAQAREILREQMARLGVYAPPPRGGPPLHAPALLDGLLRLRENLRRRRRWEDADALRNLLAAAGIDVEDTPEGPRWKPSPP
jgi:hypothetical protein